MLWNDKYATGNTQVDDEHKQIFDLVQNVLDANFSDRSQKIETVIDFLGDYTIKHFEHEERLMDESGYPGIEIHRQQHRDFLSDFVKLRDHILQSDDYTTNNITINKAVVGWLTNHVMGSDMAMADHYRRWSKAT